jgi:hypothetical protein
MKGINFARKHSEISRKAAPLGRFIVEKLHQQVSGPPRVPPGIPGIPQVRYRTGAEPRPDKSVPGSNTREAPVLRGCLRWLHARGVFAWRNNTGTTWINGQPVSFGYPGSADILGIAPDGRFLAIECKSATGKQSEKQRAFQAKIEANHGVYLLVRSVEELACLIPQ